MMEVGWRFESGGAEAGGCGLDLPCDTTKQAADKRALDSRS